MERDRSNKIDFDKYNFKYVHGDWITTTAHNFGQNLKRFFDLMIELACLSGLHNDAYLQSSFMDIPIVTEYGTVSPDLILRDNYGNIIKIVEFKCSLNPVNIINKENIEAKAKLKYGEKVVIEYLVANYNFLNLIKDRSYRWLYLTLFREISEMRKYIPMSVQMEYFKGESILPGIPEILSKSPQVQGIKDEELKHEEYQKLDDMYPQILDNIEVMEEFANGNFQPSEDMPKGMPSIKEPTIYLNHPWNQDKNREKFNKEVRNSTWGHKATIMHQIIPNRLVEPCTLEEIVPHFFKIAKTPNLADILTTTAHVYSTFPDELKEIKELFNEKAYVNTEINTEELQHMSQKLGVNPSRVNTVLDEQINDRLMKIKKAYGRDVKISKHGHPILRMDDETRKQTGLYKNKKDAEKLGFTRDGVSVLEEGDWFNKADEDYILKYFKKSKTPIPNCNGAYQFNPTLNKISDEQAAIGYERLKKVLHTRSFSSVESYMKFYRAIVAAAPRISTKGLEMDEGLITKHPDGYFIYITPSPNENLTGACVVFGKINNKFEYPDWCTPIKKHKEGESTYFMSKPFRVNLKAAVYADQTLGSYIGATAFMLNYGVDLTDNILWTSLWWAYARQESQMADLIYLFYKNAYNVGNFGKFELEKKFQKLSIRDVRVGSLFNRLKHGYSDFVTDYRKTEKTQPWNGVIDPLFKFRHTGWQTFLGICYLKQIFLSDDGYDRAALMGPFFRGEMEHRQWYDKSFFNSANLDKRKQMSIKKFFEELMKDEDKKKPSKTKWVHLSYHPDMCYRMVEKMINESYEKDPNITPHKSWVEPAMKTGKSSKCNIPLEQSYLYGVDPKYEEMAARKTRNKGLIPSDLTEALSLDSKLLTKHINEKYLMGPDSPWNNENYKIDDKMPSMIELTLFEAIIYPDCVVLTMVDKNQKGYDKRAFFVQLVFNRNANKIWDESFRPIVKTNQWDMILTPGMQKYLKFQEDMKRMNCKRGHLMVSKDATRFGDTYLMETLDLQILASHGCGYLSKDEAKMLLYFSSCIKNRIVIMPHENAKLYTQYQDENKREFLTDKERKWVLEMEKFTDYLHEPDKFDGFIKSNIMKLVKENPSFKKTVGFTLGVFNICGSMYTAAYTDLINELEKYLGIIDVFRGATHSDDAHDVTRLPCPEADQFSNMEASKLVRHLLKTNSKIEERSGEFFTTVEGKSFRVPSVVIAKLHVILTLFAPRFFSQRPSLLKWGIGHANEVLQVVQFDQQVHVPLIRYAAAIGGNLPGHSPGSDTYMSSGRVYDIIVNGGTHACASTLMLALNWLVSSMYGIEETDRNVNLPPEIGGYWWAIPGRILEEGFNANEVRLQCSNDKDLMRIMRFMINVDTTWAKEKVTNVNKEKFVIESLGLEDEVTTIEGGIEYRKDFRMKFNRTKKTSMGMMKLLEAYKDEVNDHYAKMKAKTKSFEEEDIDLAEKMKRLKDRWIIETNVGSKSIIQNLIAIAAKYTTSSMQENYVRVSPDVKLISKLGYMNRKFPNPFSPPIRSMLSDSIDLNTSIVTIKEIWNSIKYLGSTEWPTGELPEKGIKLIRKVLGNFISETRNIVVSDTWEDFPRNIDDLRCDYFRILDKRELFGIGSYSLKALAAVYDMDSAKGELELKNTFVVKNNPELEHNKMFAEQVNVMRSFLGANGFSTLDIHNHFRLLSRLLSEKKFHGIAKLPSPEFRFETSTGQFWDFDKYRVYLTSYSYREDSKEEDDNGSIRLQTDDNSFLLSDNSKSSKLPTTVRFDRVLTVLSWANFVDSDKYPLNGRLYLGSEQFVVPQPMKLMNEMMLSGFNEFKANQILASLLWHHRISGYTFVLNRTKPNKRTYILTCKIGSTPEIWCIGREVTDSEEEIWKWDIVCESYESSINVGNYLFTMGRMITYWNVSRKRRIDKLDDILWIGPATNFAKFGNEISLQDGPSPAFEYLSIHKMEKYKPTDSDLFNNFVRGRVTTIGIEFTYEYSQKNKKSNVYLITPWNLGTMSSGLTYMVNDTVLIKDNPEFEFCVTKKTYMTYYCGGLYFKMNDKYCEMELSEAIFICETIMNAIDWKDKKLSLMVEDFSLVCAAIREVELYLGIPLVMIQINASKRILKKKNPKDQIRDYINLILMDLDFGESNRMYRTQIRAIGFNILCQCDYIPSFVMEKFLDTCNDGDLNFVKKLEGINDFEHEYITVNLNKRWKVSGNLPIRVFKILISSTVGMHKTASFFRSDNSLLYRETAVDEIYLLNALFCGDNEDAMELVAYLTRV